uniref:Uncharacterized protein n=1 Tax=Arundo donax TaxID=35708 RepID=A0A0A9AE98_ARUDO
MIGLCACKATPVASSSPPTPSPVSGGPPSSMTASSTPSPSLEAQTRQLQRLS